MKGEIQTHCSTKLSVLKEGWSISVKMFQEDQECRRRGFQAFEMTGLGQDCLTDVTGYDSALCNYI